MMTRQDKMLKELYPNSYHRNYMYYYGGTLKFNEGCNAMTRAIWLQDVPMIKSLIERCRNNREDINRTFYPIHRGSQRIDNFPTHSAVTILQFGADESVAREIAELLVNAGVDPGRDCIAQLQAELSGCDQIDDDMEKNILKGIEILTGAYEKKKNSPSKCCAMCGRV